MENYCESIDYYQKPCHAPNKLTTMDDEPKVDGKGKGKAAVADHHASAADQAEPESQQEELFFSDSESGSESIEIADLKKRMWKDQLLLMKLEGRSGRDDRPHNNGEDQLELQLQPGGDDAGLVHVKEEESPESRYRCKAMLRAQDGVIRHMLKMMEACNARGFVYGVVDETGVPVSGSSDSLRGWWKDDVGFDRAGPMALSSSVAAAVSAGSPTMTSSSSFLLGLHDIQDSTLDRGLAPPWWPTGREAWWGVQGAAQAHQGPPPYRKPHDLKKAWKISLLSAVIKHLAPRFDQMRKLVWQSKRLQHKMSARDAHTWSKVITREEALDRHVQRALQITPLDEEDDDGGGPDASGDDSPLAAVAAHVDKRKRKVGGVDLGKELLALQDIDCVPDADRSSIDELMKLYYRCLQGTDDDYDGEHEAAKSAVTLIQGGLLRGGTAPDESAAVHDDVDDMLHSLLGIADVVDMSDFPDSPIWHWGFTTH